MRELEKIPLLVVCDPTACGKTDLAVRLAFALGGEVVSADSMQVYRYMDIGTAKPCQEEMRGVPHHLLDFLEPDQEFSVADYAVLARQCIREIAGRGALPILAGGTGLYIQAVADHIQYEEIRSAPALRRELEQMAEEQGNQAVWGQLRELDPVLAERLHPNNLGRVIRGIEVCRLTGVPMSRQQELSRREEAPYRMCMLGLGFRDRETLYQRINLRVDRMLERGLAEEARDLLDRGYSKTAYQAIGYKELEPYLTGVITLEEAVERIKRQTRRYAKRQLTWLRRDVRISWLYVDDYGSAGELEQAATDLVQQSGIREQKGGIHQ